MKHAFLSVLCIVVGSFLTDEIRHWSWPRETSGSISPADPGHAGWSPAAASPIPGDDARAAQQSATTAGTDPETFPSIPGPTVSEVLAPGSAFRVGYDEEARNPAWSMYHVEGDIRYTGRYHRPPEFITDTHTHAQVTTWDYRDCGYDRGHLTPCYALWAHDGQEAMVSTFIMSNVIPQNHELNAGLWEDLESHIAGRAHGPERQRGWSPRHGRLTVIVGPAYRHRPADRQLQNGTWVPDYCWAVIIAERDHHDSALAFEMPNADDPGPLDRWLTTIPAIEAQTGLDVVGWTGDQAAQLRAARPTTIWEE